LPTAIKEDNRNKIRITNHFSVLGSVFVFIKKNLAKFSAPHLNIHYNFLSLLIINLQISLKPQMEQKIHQGRNVKRFREMLGIKQEALALDLGDDWNQKKVSLLEQKETIEDPLLQKISEVLKIPVEAFQNFDEEQAINIISSNFHDNATGVIVNNYNPIDKIIQLHEEKIALYERMLKEKDDMMTRLEELIKTK